MARQEGKTDSNFRPVNPFHFLSLACLDYGAAPAVFTFASYDASENE